MTRTRSMTLVALLAFAVALSAGSASAATLPAATTAIPSGDSSLFAPLPAPVATAELRDSTVSQNGRYVAFQSQSDGLYDGDDDRVSNVYVKDRTSGAVILASRATGDGGEPTHGFCYSPSISDNGARVAFTCEKSLDPADTNGPSTDVYVRDLTTNTTYLASRAGDLGAVGDRNSSHPVLSDTGEYVAFESEAGNLDPTATGNQTRAYRRQIGGSNPTIAVSRRSAVNGGQPVSGSEPSISDDGTRIAFTSDPTQAVDPVDTNTSADVYVRIVPTNTTVLASRADGQGAVGNGTSRSPSIAGNGTSVAFESRANQFDFQNDSDASPDIYRRSLTANTTALVSITAGGQKGLVSTRPSLDDSGDVVGFVSTANQLDPDDSDTARDAYVKNLVTNVIQVASRVGGATGKVANAGAAAVAVSGDGTKVGIGMDSGSIAPDLDPRHGVVVLRDLNAPQHTDSVSRPQGTDPFASAGGFAFGGALSDDGRYAAFVSGAPALGLPDGVGSAVFVRDRVTGAVTLASRADGASGAPLQLSGEPPAISADGRRVAFTAESGADRGVWVRDLGAGKTFLASRADGPDGAAANAESRYPALDADGSRVAFTSYATNLGDGDTDGLPDIHVRDLDSGRTILASRGVGGVKGDGETNVADINADGSRVAFVTYSANLGDGDTDAQPDVHLRDLTAETTRLVSATPDGTKSNGSVSRLSLDASGMRVAFDATAGNLGANASNNHVYVRDLAANTLVVASRADGPEGAPGTGLSAGPVISPDGRFVAFASAAQNLALGLPDGAFETYVRDLRDGRTELVSRATGADGAPATGGTSPTGVSAGAGCVSFVSERSLVGPDSDFPQVYLRALRADCAAPDPDAGADTIAPVISGARLTRKRFRVGRASTPVAAKVRPGTVLRFRSTEAGKATVKFSREVRGRRGRIRLRPAGRLTRTIRAGQVRIALSGRVGRRAMRTGRYRLTLQVRDAAGNVSRPVRLRFRVAR